jgi:hypothetical protein
MASVMSVTESVAEKESGLVTSSTGWGRGKSAKASGLSWAMTMRVQASAMPTSG